MAGIAKLWRTVSDNYSAEGNNPFDTGGNFGSGIQRLAKTSVSPSRAGSLVVSPSFNDFSMHVHQDGEPLSLSSSGLVQHGCRSFAVGFSDGLFCMFLFSKDFALFFPLVGVQLSQPSAQTVQTNPRACSEDLVPEASITRTASPARQAWSLVKRRW